MARAVPEILSYTPQDAAIKRVYYLAYYQAPRYGYQETISKFLQDFRTGHEPQTSNWIALAVPRVSGAVSFDLVIRALHSNETTVGGNSPLDRLCQAIAREGGATYAPERLHKTRDIKPVGGLGAKSARQRELADIYQFNDSGLHETVRILLVDDLVTTGATLEAIAEAVKKTLPHAEITCFAIGRTQAFLHNTHLDPAVLGSEHGGMQSGARPKRQATARGATPLFGIMNALTGRAITKITRSVSALRRGQSSMTLFRQSAARGLTRFGPRLYVPVVLVSVLLLGASILIQPKSKFQRIENDLHQLANAAPAAPPSDPVTASRPARVPSIPASGGKHGIVTVPSMGLRASHSLASKVVPRAMIRNKDKVEILRKFSTWSSPDWYQVKTKSGKVGWVLASMVRESKK